MSVTLKDIASAANVSVTTVSRVVNHGDQTICSEETQKLIWKLVEQMGYSPRKRTEHNQEGKKSDSEELRIGYVLGSSENRIYDPYYAELLRGIEKEAVEEGVTIAFGFFTPNLYKPEMFAQILEDSNVQAVIFLNESNSPLYSVIEKKKHIHLIMAGVEVEEVPKHVDYVGVNIYQESVQWITQKLMNRFENVGYVGARHTKRYQAFLDAAKLCDKPLNEDFIILTDDWTADDAKIAVLQKLDERLAVPDAYFGASDLMAIGTLLALKEKGIDVPGQVKIMGFDNIEMAQYVAPTLSTINIPKFNIGREAVRLAVERVKREREYAVRIMLPTDFVQRESL